MTLIDKLSALTGPDRECDSLIFKALFPERDWVTFEENGVDIWWSRCPHDSCAFDGPPAYTASIDAAMTLLAPNTLYAIGSMEDGPFTRLCWPMPDGSYSGGYVEASAATPAIALCVASLKARNLT